MGEPRRFEKARGRKRGGGREERREKSLERGREKVHVSSAGRLANRSTVGAAGRRRQFRADRRRNHPGPCSPLLSGPSGPSSLSLRPWFGPLHDRDTRVTPPRPPDEPTTARSRTLHLRCERLFRGLVLEDVGRLLPILFFPFFLTTVWEAIVATIRSRHGPSLRLFRGMFERI